MRFNIKRASLLLSLIFFAALFCGLACVDAQDTGNDGVQVFHNRSLEWVQENNANNLYTPVSFWQLPLWVQLLYITSAVLAAWGVLKAVPLISGKLKHVFKNPKTRDIYDSILDNPGITIAELSREKGMNRGTLKYHLGQLFTNNLIMGIKKGKYTQLFYNNPRAVDKESAIDRLLKSDKNKALLFMIMDNPGITNQDLSATFDLDKSTVTGYLKKYLDDGIIEFRQDGKFKRCYLAKDARLILLRYKP